MPARLLTRVAARTNRACQYAIFSQSNFEKLKTFARLANRHKHYITDRRQLHCHTNMTSSLEMETKYADHSWVNEQYSIRLWSQKQTGDAMYNTFMEKSTPENKEALAHCRCDLNIPYASITPRNTMDIFYPPDRMEATCAGGDSQSEHVPVVIFIHGGYFRLFNKDMYSYVGGTLSHRGLITCVIQYDLAPSSPVCDIVGQVRQAVAFAGQRFPDSDLYVCGHSVGGHLTASIALELNTDDNTPANTDECSPLIRTDIIPHGVLDRIKGYIPLSGVFDIRPLVNYSTNEALRLTMDEATDLSPYCALSSAGKKKPRLTLADESRFLVAVGGAESPEFIRQSREFAQLVNEHGGSSEFLIVDGADHYNVMENFLETEAPDSRLVNRIMEFISDGK